MSWRGHHNGVARRGGGNIGGIASTGAEVADMGGNEKTSRRRKGHNGKGGALYGATLQPSIT
jgi:hypothetical protein